MKNLQTFEEYLNESTNELIKPDTTAKRGDIVTIYGKRYKKNAQSKIGDISLEMGGSYIGKKEYAIEIIAAEVDKNSIGKDVIYKSYFLDGEEVLGNISFWYLTQKGKGEKYLHKYEKNS